MKNRALKIIVSISAAAPAFAAAIALAQRLPHKAAIPAGLAAALLTAALVFAFLRKKDLSPRFKDLPKRPETAFYAFFLEAVCSAAALSAGSYVSGSWKGSALASALHISRTGLGYLIAGLITAAALPAVIFACVSFTGRAAGRPALSPKLRGFAYGLLLLLIPVIWHVSLQYSCLKKIPELSLMRWYMFALGTAFLLALELLFIALSGRLRLPAAVLSVSVSVWSLANYYVVLYHGSPLFISTLASARTAAGVLSGYKVTLPPNAVNILALLALDICLSLMLPKRLSPEGRGKAPAKLRALAGASALVLAGAFFFCVSDRDIMPENTMDWFWGVGVDEYGYIACNYEDASNRLRPLAVPEGYSPEAVNGIPLNGRTAASEEHPDIIIILNESFYDLSVYSDMEFDRDYLKSFYSIEGAHCGFACKPRQGTTNNAEMELLTSNSMALLPLEAPFNYFDFTEYRHSLADDLIVSGYSTAVMHVNRTNYSRHIVYPQLGFETVCLGYQYFHHYETYGEREWTDRGNYLDMEELYDSMGEGPRFVFLLTIQNHSGYEMNDPSYDTVHVLGDHGNYNDKINEYATSVAMSADAFAELTGHYRDSDRPVIIFMTGDHGPYFMYLIRNKESFSEDERLIAALTLPYIVWSNFDMEWPESASELSFTDIAPLIKQAAGLPLSAYDELILRLHEKAPFRIPFSYYRDRDGVIKEMDLSGSDEVSALMRDYFYAEYNLLKGGDDYRAELFEIKK